VFPQLFAFDPVIGIARMAVGHLSQIGPLADLLFAAAEVTVAATRSKFKTRRTRRVGSVIRPGPDTPLWNELALAVQRRLRRRGEKVKLARLIGISRQRLHLLLVAKTACPDAERALELLAWLLLQQKQSMLDPRTRRRVCHPMDDKRTR
jgi:hypothetical protein